VTLALEEPEIYKEDKEADLSLVRIELIPCFFVESVFSVMQSEAVYVSFAYGLSGPPI
jgi:hypothetical protein